jgi:threonine synthase
MKLMGRGGFCVESASAVAVAGLAHGRRQGWIADDERAVAVVTSSGIKWPYQLNQVTHSATQLEPTLAALQDALSARGLNAAD